MMTKVIDKVMPAYPASARQAGREGTVVVRLNVDPEGCPVGLTVESGDPTLTQAVESALFQWRFRPTVVRGQARWVITTVSVMFSLSENLATHPDTRRTSAMLLVTPGTASPPPPPLQGDWPPYESTRKIRQSCVPDKPRPASAKTPLGPRSCAIWRIHMGSDYEELVDRGIELRKTICTTMRGWLSITDPDFTTKMQELEELQRVRGELIRRQSTIRFDRVRSTRIIVDYNRLAGDCPK